MQPISIDRFAEMTVKNNPDETLADLKTRLSEAVLQKKEGACCGQCGQAIWAIGSAIVGYEGCFTCITGEADASDDYEIDEVCWL